MIPASARTASTARANGRCWREDPAHDAASLGLWYGWDALRAAVSEGVYERARLHARTFPLQAVAYALHHDLDTAQVNQAVARADDWIEANLRVPSA